MRHFSLGLLVILSVAPQRTPAQSASTQTNPRLAGKWTWDAARSDPMPVAIQSKPSEATPVPKIGTPPVTSTASSGGVVVQMVLENGVLRPATSLTSVTPDPLPPAAAISPQELTQLRKASTPVTMVIAISADTTFITEAGEPPTAWLTDNKPHKVAQNSQGIALMKSGWTAGSLSTSRGFANKVEQQRKLRIGKDGESLEMEVTWVVDGARSTFNLVYRRQ